jgi:hypothetical protein
MQLPDLYLDDVHLVLGIEIVKQSFAQSQESTLTKDISWLWRVSYNTAVELCSEFGVVDKRVTHLFDISKSVSYEFALIDKASNSYDTPQFLELRARVVVVPPEPEVFHYTALVAFSALSGRSRPISHILFDLPLK